MIKLRREDEGGVARAVRAWEEICVMGLGGMVQAELATGMIAILIPTLIPSSCPSSRRDCGVLASIVTVDVTQLTVCCRA